LELSRLLILRKRVVCGRGGWSGFIDAQQAAADGNRISFIV
jgi:hypothetical protein